MHISSSYAKILGEKLFRTWEIPRSGSKAKNGEKRKIKRERERERLNDGDNNGQATHGARKHAWLTQAAWANKNPVDRVGGGGWWTSLIIMPLGRPTGLSSRPRLAIKSCNTSLFANLSPNTIE